MYRKMCAGSPSRERIFALISNACSYDFVTLCSSCIVAERPECYPLRSAGEAADGKTYIIMCADSPSRGSFLTLVSDVRSCASYDSCTIFVAIGKSWDWPPCGVCGATIMVAFVNVLRSGKTNKGLLLIPHVVNASVWRLNTDIDHLWGADKQLYVKGQDFRFWWKFEHWI